MDPRVKELLRPEMINSLNGLELVARVIAEGFMSGANKSQAVGTGQEFSQYRSYEPGDDLRQLDWKMYARSERYFVKQSEIETNIAVKFFIDASASMEYREEEWSKFEYAKVVTAALVYLVRKQGDNFGLYLLSDSGAEMIHPRFEQQQYMRVLSALADARTGKNFARTDDAQHLVRGGSKEIVFFITDLYDNDEDLLSFVATLKTTRNEVIVFHLMGRREMNLDKPGSFTFEEIESGKRVRISTTEARAKYTEKLASWRSSVREQLMERSIYYQLVMINELPEAEIRNFIKIRNTLLR